LALLRALGRVRVGWPFAPSPAFSRVPPLAVATSAPATLPTGVSPIPRRTLFFLPQAVAVALPIAAATAVFVVCRTLPATRQLWLTVGAFTVAMALVAAALNVSVAPVTNAMYRKLAFGDADGRSVNGRRLNALGEPGNRFQMDHRWTLPESVLLFAALAFAASRAVPPHARR